MKQKYVIIVAGGHGSRMGTAIPKQFLLLNGKPVLIHTLEVFYNYDPEIQIIVVLPKEHASYWRTLRKKYGCNIKHQVVAGGETRFHSVKNGLKLIKTDAIIAIHDGVRPLVSPELLTRLFKAVETERAVYPVVPIAETLRRVIMRGSSKMVDRSKFYMVQTPQIFFSKLLQPAYTLKYSEKFTDDVSVVEARRMCKPVMVEGCTKNIKITTPVDLLIAEAIMKGKMQLESGVKST
jgi:2-C-methyl-D-erythritol 4-phosphate cytidylyltransferase